MRGVFSNANDICRFLMIFPRISLYCRLVPVQYRECENGLLAGTRLDEENVHIVTESRRNKTNYRLGERDNH